MRRPVEFIALACLVLAACGHGMSPPLLGTLEWDRVGVAAEAAEPIVAIAVNEGDHVETGALILQLDPRRTDARLAAARAELQHSEVALAELLHGARLETIAAARADLAGAESTVVNARRERERAAELRSRGLVAQADLDRADTVLKTAGATAAAARARLEELVHGTRPEDIAQAEAARDAAQAGVDELVLTRARLDVRAPRAGRIDALPFKLGDQPPIGATLVSLLAGEAPYARLFVPESRRAALAPNAKLRVTLDGDGRSFDATLRRLAADPAFTPYYALTGDDASRLVWRAEAVLEGAAARELPAGLPLHAEIAGRDP